MELQTHPDAVQVIGAQALKPALVGVPAYRDHTREYVEIAVMRLNLRAGASADRLRELVHRAIPYPVVLIAEDAAAATLSLAHKRFSQSDDGQSVVDGELVHTGLDEVAPTTEWVSSFLKALRIDRQPGESLFALYQGWIDTVVALQIACVTEMYEPSSSREHAARRHAALQECHRLGVQIAGLRSAATNEKQLARQVELNLELNRLKAALAAARKVL